MRYKVKSEYADDFYGRDVELDYIEDCQTNGIPAEDIEHMIREYGKEVIMNMLEEI